MTTSPAVIRMSFVENLSVQMIATSAWEIKYTRRWRWLQRACEWVLRRTGALRPHFDRKQLMHNVAIDTEKAALEIVRLAGDQMQRVGLRPKRILVGRSQFESILTEIPDFNRHPFSFDIRLQRYDKPRGPYDTSITVLDVPVQVIPWMDGILVLAE